MRFRFFLSGQQGDIEFSEEELRRPFLLNPSEEHPFLTLADYFGALQQFIMLNKGNLLQSVLKNQVALSEIPEIIIRSEKHGAFYHIASIELPGPESSVKLAVTTAVTPSARTSLHEEYAILQRLTEISADLIPETYYKKSIIWKTDSDTEEFVMVLSEWLTGYHEWHISDVPDTGDRRVHLWDYDKGFLYLEDDKTYELMRQAASILTCYYDQDSFRQIYPWHHGAGDFIVNAGPDGISVKLITARQYDPLVHFEQPEETDRLVAAIHFLLNLSLRMRLDRLDGIIEPVWLGPYAVHAAVAGFFDRIAAMQEDNNHRIGPASEFLEIMQSFDEQEILDMYGSLLEIYKEEDPDDFQLIQENLAEHAAELYKILQGHTFD
jgi:hypothetical protein